MLLRSALLLVEGLTLAGSAAQPTNRCEKSQSHARELAFRDNLHKSVEKAAVLVSLAAPSRDPGQN